MKLNRYLISGKIISSHHTIVARTRALAWGKFVTQYFGVLKPNRDDYSITVVC